METSPRTIRLTDDAWQLFVQAKEHSGLGWEGFVRGLIAQAPLYESMALQLDAQAGRFGKTRGQIIRFLSSLIHLEELGFIVIEGEVRDQLYQACNLAKVFPQQMLRSLIDAESQKIINMNGHRKDERDKPSTSDAPEPERESSRGPDRRPREKAVKGA